jgi:hypothetical protein
MRAFVWLVCAVGLGYLCYRFAAWRFFAQFGLMVLLISWIVLGVAMIGQAVRRSRPEFRTKARPNLQADMMRARAQFVLQHDEQSATWIENGNPRIWQEIVLGLREMP